MKTLSNAEDSRSSLGQQVVSEARSKLTPRPQQRLIAEWQQHGPGTLSGHTLRKLRLSFAQSQSAAAAA